jgi:hypothetical protein
MHIEWLTYYARAAKVVANPIWEREQVRQPQKCYIQQRGRRGHGVVDEEDRCVIVMVVSQIRMGDESECDRSLLRTNA